MPVSASCAMLAMLWHPELWVTFAWLREVIGCYNSNSSAGKASHQFDFHQNQSSIITNIKVQVAPTFPAPLDTHLPHCAVGQRGWGGQLLLESTSCGFDVQKIGIWCADILKYDFRFEIGTLDSLDHSRKTRLLNNFLRVSCFFASASPMAPCITHGMIIQPDPAKLMSAQKIESCLQLLVLSLHHISLTNEASNHLTR